MFLESDSGCGVVSRHVYKDSQVHSRVTEVQLCSFVYVGIVKIVQRGKSGPLPLCSLVEICSSVVQLIIDVVIWEGIILLVVCGSAKDGFVGFINDIASSAAFP